MMWHCTVPLGFLAVTGLAGCASAADLPTSSAMFYARPSAAAPRQHRPATAEVPRAAPPRRAIVAELPADVRYAPLRPTLD